MSNLTLHDVARIRAFIKTNRRVFESVFSDFKKIDKILLNHREESDGSVSDYDATMILEALEETTCESRTQKSDGDTLSQLIYDSLSR